MGWKHKLEETIRSGFQDEGEDAISVVACTLVMPVGDRGVERIK